MKRIININFLFLLLFTTTVINAQEGFIIDHDCIDLSDIPMQWIDSAKAKLHIGYGHTSHGSQITTGMTAVERYYTEGEYDWSHEGGAGELLLFEGSDYDTGYLELDVGYANWDYETRVYLNDFPECNVIIWSWCGQVDTRDLTTHYFERMAQLELDYPDVTFVYMTGHLEGKGIGGTVYDANQSIRSYCSTNNKILFDFADIEKYSPDLDTNYQQYFADDECEYIPRAGDTLNWAQMWIANNPTSPLKEMADLSNNCAHSEKINCVKKGIAAWYLWARIAGWEKIATNTNLVSNDEIKLFPNPVQNKFTIYLPTEANKVILKIFDTQGKQVYSDHVNVYSNKIELSNLNLSKGMYIVNVDLGEKSYQTKLIK
jgi:hypothetical protein